MPSQKFPLKLPNPRLSFEGLLSQSFDHTCREHGNLARLAADDPPGELQGVGNPLGHGDAELRQQAADHVDQLGALTD